MRKVLGLIGLAVGSTAFGQFAVDRKPPVAPAPAPQEKPATPPAANTGVTDLLPYTPTGPSTGNPTPTRPSFTPPPGPAPLPQAPRTAHPLAVAPQHGEWLICVKSYSGADALAYAERLAADVRKQHPGWPVYLFEYFAEERAKLAAEQAKVRQMAYDQAAPFYQMQDEIRKKTEATGGTFVDDGPKKVRVQKLLTQIPEQWAVLVGGFKTNETARKALDQVHGWKPPTDPALMDKMTAMHGKPPSDGEQFKLKIDDVVDVNPYPTAMCVKNPSLPKTQKEAPADPALWKWNDGEPLSVLNVPKPYTMIVKAYTMPFIPLSKDREPSVMQAFGQDRPGVANNAQMLAITAKQARDLAIMLRSLTDKNKQPVGFDAYVLHMQTGSIVCIGQFDREDDPQMAAVATRLANLKLNLTQDQYGQQAIRPGERSFFDQISVLKIPRR